jgi:uncharacterized membrane protein
MKSIQSFIEKAGNWSDIENLEDMANKFFDTYGTHAQLGAKFGGKIFMESSYDAEAVFKATGFLDLVLGNEGWCEAGSSSCEIISEGKTTSNAYTTSGVKIANDLNGYCIGSPGWITGIGVKNRLDNWLTAASTQSTV